MEVPLFVALQASPAVGVFRTPKHRGCCQSRFKGACCGGVAGWARLALRAIFVDPQIAGTNRIDRIHNHRMLPAVLFSESQDLVEGLVEYVVASLLSFFGCRGICGLSCSHSGHLDE